MGVMLINVSQLLKSSIGTSRDYEVSEIINIAGNNSTVKGKVRLIRTDLGVLAQGTLYAGIKIACSRCLEMCDYPLSLNIEEEYLPINDVNSGKPLSLTLDEHIWWQR